MLTTDSLDYERLGSSRNGDTSQAYSPTELLAFKNHSSGSSSFVNRLACLCCGANWKVEYDAGEAATGGRTRVEMLKGFMSMLLMGRGSESVLWFIESRCERKVIAAGQHHYGSKPFPSVAHKHCITSTIIVPFSFVN